MTLGNVYEYLPRILPEGPMYVDEDREFIVLDYDGGGSDEKETYLLNKAPVESVESVTGIVGGSTYTFVEGTDYAVIDDDNDGEIDSIDFSIGGENPDGGTDFTVTYIAIPIIQRYIESHEIESETFDGNVDDVIESHQVNYATGSNLDRIGALFGDLGRRRGRSDDEYRALIRSIVQSFKGRGTVPGLKFAIAAGVGIDEDNVVIDEDFVQVGYEIRLKNVNTQFLTSVVNDMADLADPSGVELLSTPIVVLDGEVIIIDESDSSLVSTTTGLGSGTLTLDGNSQLQ